MAERILVTGATGNVGAEVARLLIEKGREQGFPVRIAVRNVQKAKAKFGEDAKHRVRLTRL